MNYYPAFIDLRDKPCLVLGNGSRPLRQIERLLTAGARVSVVPGAAPECLQMPTGAQILPNTTLAEPDSLGLIEWSGFQLVICDTGSDSTDALVARHCHDSNVLCNLPGQSEQSSFLTPAVVDRSPLLIAVASGGIAPALSRALKSRLESAIPPAYGEMARLIERYSSRIAAKIPEKAERAAFWHDLLERRFSSLAYTAGLKNVHAQLEQIASSDDPTAASSAQGSVALVGAGPGAPDLLTFRALRLIQNADTIVYDRLVSQDILDLKRNDAEMIYAGKEKSRHAIAQPDINDLLVQLAKQGKTVVRLKGGDPFIFGRGGEEIETLVENGVEFQVVPGITAASGCAAFAGIPLTHRDHAQSCVFVTGHLRDNNINLNWKALIDPSQTIVVYMGLTGLKAICTELILAGRTPDTPAALVEQGTTEHHRVHTATLATLTDSIADKSVKAPTLLIIGGVVSLREKLNWYDPVKV